MALKPAIYIGLDPATDCGFAVLTAGGRRVESGTWRLKEKKGELRAARWLGFAKNVRDLVNKYKAKYSVIVTYEYAPYQKGRKAAEVYGGWISQLDIAEAEHRSVRWQRISVDDWKFAFVGKKRADKNEYIAAANKRYSLSLVNKKGLGGEDEAAALGVAYASIVLRSKLLLEAKKG